MHVHVCTYYYYYVDVYCNYVNVCVVFQCVMVVRGGATVVLAQARTMIF